MGTMEKFKIMNENGDKYAFLDNLVIDDYLINREYMKIIINEDPTDPITSIADFQTSMNELIDIKIKELNDYCQVIIANLLGEMVPSNCSHEKKIHYRKLKYLSFLYNKVLVKKNKLLISSIQNIKKDILSLVHLCSVFPFIEEKINFKQKLSFEKIYSEIRKEVEIKYNEITVEYSTKVARALNFYTESLPTSEIPKFEYTLPITEDSLFSFSCLINSIDFPLQKEIQEFVSNFNDQIFIQKVCEISTKMIEILNLKQSAFKHIAQYIVKYVFSASEFVFHPLLEFSSFFPDSKKKTVSEFDIPSYLVSKDISMDTKLADFIESNELLKEASIEFFQLIFEPSPIDVLIRLDRVLKDINTYITSMVKKEGEILAFIPFDDTFILLCAVIVVSNVPNFDGLIQFISVFVEDKILVNELSFAQNTLRCAAEYQKNAKNQM